MPVPENPKCPQCGTPLPAGVLGGLCPACLLKQGTSADTASPTETKPFVPPSVAEMAKLFPQLEIIRFLGKGGMGAVYLARQPSLDRMVALKILPAQSDSGFEERFAREARALARLSHPNIVAVYEFGLAGDLHYFLMEYVDGVNLRQLEVSGRLSPREALQIVPQLCDALQYAHDEGVVHRDIKPENVLMDRRGRVKIADFGLAKMLGTDTENIRLTGAGHVMGTPHYMSPEQVEHPLDVDHRADIYSLGVVFYEMLTGELPIGRFPLPSSKVQIDVRLDEVVLRTLEKEPSRRYQQASQIKTAMDTISHSSAPPPSANADALARQILERDYVLDIGSCISRGWELVKSDFWPLVGITALVVVLWTIASSVGGTAVKTGPGHELVTLSWAVGILVWGPLFGGLLLHYLKRIRGEVSAVDTAFSGFTKRFLHLFLAGFVMELLTTVGFLCCVLPGIYLSLAWMFTLPLVMDKGIDFWPAMELSRKVITRHWWKFLGLVLMSGVVMIFGLLACCVGVFVAIPIVLAAQMYAYEDIFGGAQPASKAPPIFAGPAGPGGPSGPSGTEIMPSAAAKPAKSGTGTRSSLFMVLAVVAAFAALLIVVTALTFIGLHHARSNRIQAQTVQAQRDRAALLQGSWSPVLAEGGKPDGTKIGQEAKELTDTGQYEEALKRYVWYWNHAQEYHFGSSGVRLINVLPDWIELGRRYPPAKQALVEIRDRQTQDFAEGKGYFTLFMEIQNENQYLQEDDATLNLFKSLRDQDAALATQCFASVKNLLVNKHEYTLYMDYVPDAQAAFVGIRQEWQQMKQFENSMAQSRGDMQNGIEEARKRIEDTKKQMEETRKRMEDVAAKLREGHPQIPAPPGYAFTPPAPPKTADNNFVNQTRLLIEALIGTEQKPEAEKIQAQAVALLPDERLKSAVTDAEKRIAQNN